MKNESSIADLAKMTPDEMRQSIDERLSRFDELVKENAVESYPYTLPKWLELKRWDKHEGLCIICDIDPELSDISRLDGLVRNIAPLSCFGFERLPRLDEMSQEEVESLGSSDPKFLDKLRLKSYLLGIGQSRLHRAAKLYERNTTRFAFRTDDEESPESPREFVEFAKRYNINIPWLDWAIKNKLIDLRKEEDADASLLSGPPAEAFERRMQEADARALRFKARRKESARVNYPLTLPRWLELHRWEKNEGLCLICDIDPDHAEIHWYDRPTIKNAGFLSNLDIADYPQLEDYSYDDRKPLDADFIETLHYKSYLISTAEIKLQRAKKLYERNTDFLSHPDSPREYLDFAQLYDIEVPWLEWAESESLVPEHIEKEEIPFDAVDAEDADALRLDIGETRDAGQRSLEKTIDKPLKTTERVSFLLIMDALLKEAGIVDPTKAKITTPVMHILEKHGVSLDRKTVKDKLDQIADAKERRGK